MGTIFQSRPGQVAVLASPDNDIGLPITVDGIGGSWFPSFQAILTGMMFGLDGNFQFTHTCKDVIYAYVFGNRISQMMISGLGFSDGCPGGNEAGISQVLAWWRANSIAARDTPIQVQLGTASAGRFRGYMTGIRGEILKPEARISQFSLIFHVFPGNS